VYLRFNIRKIFLGGAAGFMSGIVALLLAYCTGVIVIAVRLRELPAALLAAVTVLPLMIIFVLLVPTLIISLGVGFLSGLAANFTKRAYSSAFGALIGLCGGEIVLSLILVLITSPKAGDFVSIISNRYLSGAYGLLVGGLTSLMFRWVASE